MCFVLQNEKMLAGFKIREGLVSDRLTTHTVRPTNRVVTPPHRDPTSQPPTLTPTPHLYRTPQLPLPSSPTISTQPHLTTTFDPLDLNESHTPLSLSLSPHQMKANFLPHLKAFKMFRRPDIRFWWEPTSHPPSTLQPPCSNLRVTP